MKREDLTFQTGFRNPNESASLRSIDLFTEEKLDNKQCLSVFSSGLKAVPCASLVFTV